MKRLLQLLQFITLSTLILIVLVILFTDGEGTRVFNSYTLIFNIVILGFLSWGN